MATNKLYASGQNINIAIGESYTILDYEVSINDVLCKKSDVEICIEGLNSNENQDNVFVGIRKRDGVKGFPASPLKYTDWEINGSAPTSLADLVEQINTIIQ